MTRRGHVRKGGTFRSDGWCQPLIIMPVQRFLHTHRQHPEIRLMVAILQDAIECYYKGQEGKSDRARRLFREAEKWLMIEQPEWPFSFRNICDVLDLEPTAIRKVLQSTRHPAPVLRVYLHDDG